MFDNKKELLEKIQLGEDTFLEVKEVRFSGGRVTEPHRDSIADELAAFANSRGGVFILGVEDRPREIVGIPIERMDEVEQLVAEVCNDSIEPPLAPIIERLRLPASTGDEVAVIKIDVPRGVFVHRSPGGYLQRIGSNKRVMLPDFLSRLLQQRSQTGVVRFDEQLVSKATIHDLNPETWRRYHTPRTRDETQDFLTKLGMAGLDDEGIERPTVAGVLMASEDPQRWLPNAFVQAVAYHGADLRVGDREVNYQLDAADITGPLDLQIKDTCRFVKRNMKTAAVKDTGRIDKPQFDMTAVFEAVVNAVAHRDYSIYGSKIRLRLFSNRLELYSPGALPNTLTIESLPYRQSTRNEVISGLLARCPVPENINGLDTDRHTLMDRRGEGVRIILENSQRLSHRVPDYTVIDEAELMLTIYAAN